MLLEVASRPETITGAIWVAALAACGYIGKTVVELSVRWERKRRESLARLIRLSSLLDASWTAYAVQSMHRDRLISMLEARDPSAIPNGGYELVFATLYDSFTPDEHELHKLIRAITIHALRPINLSMLRWLEEDTEFRTNHDRGSDNDALSVELNELARHLLLWHAKYRTWIPEHPGNALVYMADEEHHGLGFPSGIEERVRKAVKREKLVLPDLANK